MQTVYETRRLRLRMLKEKYLTWAALNEALGWDRTNARLSQYHNATARKDRGTTYLMGDPTAREIEVQLGLELGWMDTPPSYAELHGEHDHRAQLLQAMEGLPADQWPVALRLIDALAKPAGKNGTNN